MDKYEIISSDWGSWDATYRFAEDANQAYIDENFPVDTVVSMEMNYLILMSNDGELLQGMGVRLKQQDEAKISQELLDLLHPAGPVLDGMGEAQNLSGFVGVNGKVLLVSAAPILRGDDSGESRGFFIVGRYLDRELQDDFIAQTQLELSFPKTGRRRLSRPDCSNCRCAFLRRMTLTRSPILNRAPNWMSPTSISLKGMSCSLISTAFRSC
ncbi:MAG: CHASE4 domain-containing protein [Roseobacter sp.]